MILQHVYKLIPFLSYTDSENIYIYWSPASSRLRCVAHTTRLFLMCECMCLCARLEAVSLCKTGRRIHYGSARAKPVRDAAGASLYTTLEHIIYYMHIIAQTKHQSRVATRRFLTHESESHDAFNCSRSQAAMTSWLFENRIKTVSVCAVCV